MTVIICLLALTLAAGAAASEPQHLGQPCRAKNVLAGRVVTDRSTGREQFVLTNTNEDSGLELIFIDYEKDTGRVFRAPAGSGSWALNEIPGDRLAIGTYYDGKYIIFDLKKMEFIKTAAFPGESYIWNLALGSDGRLYGGTYGGGKLGALDLETYEVEDCGAPARPNMYLRNVSALPDGRILCQFGMEKPTTLIYDPSSKKFDPVPEQLEGVQIGVTWNGYFLAGANCYDGKTLEKINTPFTPPPAEKGTWSVDTYMTTSDVLFIRQGSAVYRYKAPDKEPVFIADIDLRGGRLLAGNSKGVLLGVRGQDYFVIKPGDKDLSLKPIPVESAPRPIMFLQVDPQGRIWGGPHFGQTLFWLDPKTKKAVNTSNICDAGGEVYDVAFHNGKTYAVAYAGGDIVRYDPEEPWDQWNRKNPVLLADVGGKGYIRPIAGVIVGPDSKLYSGWMAKYGTYGGAVAITDPISGETELIENPLGEQAVSGVVADRNSIYLGTSLGANGLPNKKGESARFGVLDIKTKKPEFEHVFEGSSAVRVLGCDSKSQQVALSVNGVPWLFDPKSRSISALPAETPKISGHSITEPVGGIIYYGSGKSVIALDLVKRTFNKIAELPDNVTNTAIGPDGSVYASCGVDLYKVKSSEEVNK